PQKWRWSGMIGVRYEDYDLLVGFATLDIRRTSPEEVVRGSSKPKGNARRPEPLSRMWSWPRDDPVRPVCPIRLKSMLQSVPIIANLLGTMSKVLGWVSDRLRGVRGESPILRIPRRSLIVLDTPYRELIHWRMGRIVDKPAMQVVGRVRVTNKTR